MQAISFNPISQRSQADQPTAPKREKHSASAEPREITEKSPDPVQSRPLPPPPAPPRTLKKKSTSLDEAEGRATPTSPSFSRDLITETENFKTCAETLHTEKTLVDSMNKEKSSFSDDITLADSCVDSLVSCAETLLGDNDRDMETCAETLRDEDQTEFFSDDDMDNPYPAVDFGEEGNQILERPGRSQVRKNEAGSSGRRLEEGTQQLSLELMEHVESLKTTLDNMSSRLGTRSRSRSHSTSRPSSKYRPQDQ